MTRTRGLTDIAIRNLKAGPARQEIPDPGARGLYCIVEPSGFKSFAVRFRFDGKARKLSLGNIPLSVARKAAADALHEVGQGRDPTAAKKRARARRRAIEADTFAAITERYFQIVCGLKRHGDRPTFNDTQRTASHRLANLERLVLPVLGNRPVSELRRSEIVAVLDKIELTNGPAMADKMLGVVRSILNWHAARSDDFRSPIVRGMARTKGSERARRRILSDDEICRVWADNEGPFSALIKFLLLSSARREEAAQMTFDELRDGVWELPAARNKTKLPLARPLSRKALEIIEGQRRDGSVFVFSIGGDRPLQNITRSKRKLDAATGTEGWTLHDCRRTARSLMSRAGVNADHAERCLGHVIGGVRQTYDRYEFHREKQLAFEALAAQIEVIVSPPKGNVTSLRKSKRA
jgi:integrase